MNNSEINKSCTNCKYFERYYVKRPWGFKPIKELGHCKKHRKKEIKLCDDYEEEIIDKKEMLNESIQRLNARINNLHNILDILENDSFHDL